MHVSFGSRWPTLAVSRGPWARGLVVQCCCCFLSPCVHCPCRPCCSGHCRVCRSPRLGNSEDPRTGSGMCQPDRRPGSESCQWFTVFSSTRQVRGKLCRTRRPQRAGRTAWRCAPSVPILARPLAQPSRQVHGVSAASETTAGEAKDTTEQGTAAAAASSSGRARRAWGRGRRAGWPHVRRCSRGRGSPASSRSTFHWHRHHVGAVRVGSAQEQEAAGEARPWRAKIRREEVSWAVRVEADHGDHPSGQTAEEQAEAR